MTTHLSRHLTLGGVSLMLLASLSPARLAAQSFDAADPDFKGRVRSTTRLVVPGTKVSIEGAGFKPGQSVTVLRGTKALNSTPYVADAQGVFKGTIDVPADAVPGTHSLIVTAAGPYGAGVFDLKVSPNIPISGASEYSTKNVNIAGRLYQVAYSPKSDRIFVTSAMGRPPAIVESELIKLNAETLTVEARAKAAPVPGATDGRVFAVYGVSVDDEKGNVWVTNSRQNTVAVYKQSDLSLVKQFPADVLPHSRDIVVDAKRGRAYGTAVGKNVVAVFDTNKLELVKYIEIPTKIKGYPPVKFNPSSLDLDPATGKIATVSMETAEAAVIDTNGGVEVISLPPIRSGIGVAYNSAGKRLYVVSQGSDDLLVLDTETNKVLKQVPVGAGALNVAFDPVNKLVYVSNRGAGTVAVLDAEGKLVANLEAGAEPNHVQEDGRGNVFVVSTSQGRNITRISKK